MNHSVLIIIVKLNCSRILKAYMQLPVENFVFSYDYVCCIVKLSYNFFQGTENRILPMCITLYENFTVQ